MFLRALPSVFLTIACLALVGHLALTRGTPGFSGTETPSQQSRIPHAANRWRALTLLDEYGRIEPDAPERARAQANAMLDAGGDRPAVAGIGPHDWIALGPGEYGGRIRSILIDPSNPDAMLVGSVTGGIWRTTNGGASWASVDDFLDNLSINSMARDPSRPQILYAGTGESYVLGTGYIARGSGMYKSVDGGATWQGLASTNSHPSPGLSAGDFYAVYRIAVSPDGVVLLVSTGTGIFRSLDGGESFTRAVYAGGQPIPPVEFPDIEFDPRDSSRAVAGTFAGEALYSRDGGATWQIATGLPGDVTGGTRVELTYAPSDPAIVYAGVDLDRGRLFKSTDGGVTFVAVLHTAAPLTGQGNYNNALWVSPHDANYILWGGIDLFRSRNGGATFERISNWTLWRLRAPTSLHADHHAITAHPGFNGTSNRTIFFGNDGGIYRAVDIDAVPTCTNTQSCRTGWEELNNGLGVTQFYAIDAEPSTGRLLGGTQDNGLMFYDPRVTEVENRWTTWATGDGLNVAWDPTDPARYYGSFYSLLMFRASPTSPFQPIGRTAIPEVDNDAPFDAPMVLDKRDPTRLIAGGRQVWRTSNLRDNVPVFERIRGALGARTNSWVTALAISPLDSDTIWVGYLDGRVAVTRNGTAPALDVQWETIDDNGAHDLLPARYVTSIVPDPHDPAAAYVTFGGYRGDNLYRVIAGGAGAVDVTGSGARELPHAPVRDVVVHPTESGWLYAATEVGLFVSADNGATWARPDRGPANAPIEDLLLFRGELYAATYGRGVFKTAIALRPGQPEALSASIDGHTVTLSWRAGASGGAVREYLLQVRATADGPVIASHRSGSSATTLTTTVPSGVFHVSVIAINDEGQSPESARLGIAVGEAAQVPGPPSNVTLATGVNTLTLSWQPPAFGAAVTAYRLDVGSAPGQTDIATMMLPASSTSFTPGVSVPNGSYYLRLTPLSAAGAGESSREVVAHIGQAPSLQSTRTGNRVDFTWTADVTGGAPQYFVLHVGSAPGLSDLASSQLTTTRISVEGVPAGTYYVRVVAVYASGASRRSNEVTVVVP